MSHAKAELRQSRGAGAGRRCVVCAAAAVAAGWVASGTAQARVLEDYFQLQSQPGGGTAPVLRITGENAIDSTEGSEPGYPFQSFHDRVDADAVVVDVQSTPATLGPITSQNVLEAISTFGSIHEWGRVGSDPNHETGFAGYESGGVNILSYTDSTLPDVRFTLASVPESANLPHRGPLDGSGQPGAGGAINSIYSASTSGGQWVRLGHAAGTATDFGNKQKYIIEFGNYEHAEGDLENGTFTPGALVRAAGFTLGNNSSDVRVTVDFKDASGQIIQRQMFEDLGGGRVGFNPAGMDGGGTAGAEFYFGLDATTFSIASIELLLESDLATYHPFDDFGFTGLDVTPVVNATWNVNIDGNWSAAGNWTGGLPNAADAVANFGSIIDAARTVTVDAAHTVGTINFDNANSYTIAGAGALTVEVSTGSAALNVVSGSHTISAPLTLVDNTSISVAAGSTLTVSALQSSTGAVTKAGDGALAVNNLRAAGLAVNAGTVRVLPDGSAAGTSKVASLSVASGAKLDLTNNKLITASPAGTWTGTAYDGVAGLVDSGRGSAGNALWNGSTGIVTTDTRAIDNGDLLSIGVAKVGDVRTVADTETTMFAGQTVLGSDTLAMVTWGGDANLDGKINIDDYGRIDGNVGQSGSVFGWSKGDFNYDGKINIDDYGIIDGNINRQGAPFAVTGSATSVALDGVGAIPEPASLSLLAVGAIGLLRRRRGAVLL